MATFTVKQIFEVLSGLPNNAKIFIGGDEGWLEIVSLNIEHSPDHKSVNVILIDEGLDNK